MYRFADAVPSCARGLDWEFRRPGLERVEWKLAVAKHWNFRVDPAPLRPDLQLRLSACAGRTWRQRRRHVKRNSRRVEHHHGRRLEHEGVVGHVATEPAL